MKNLLLLLLPLMLLTGCSETSLNQDIKSPKAPPVNANRLMNVNHGVLTSKDCYRGSCYVRTDYGEIRYIDDPYWTYKNPFPAVGEVWLEDFDSYHAHVKTLTVDEWALEKGLTK